MKPTVTPLGAVIAHLRQNPTMKTEESSVVSWGLNSFVLKDVYSSVTGLNLKAGRSY
jgi:hypothetical protein